MTAMPPPNLLIPAASSVLDVQAGYQQRLNACFGLASGQITALLGGAQEPKSLLFSLLLGLKNPSFGHIRLQGRTFVDQQTGHWLPPHKRGIGFVGLDPHLWPDWRVGKNIYSLCPKRKSVLAADLDGMIQHFGIAPHINARIGTLSPEQQWLVGFLRAVAATETMLIAETIPHFKDTAIRADVFKVLQQIAHTGTPVLLGCDQSIDALRYADAILGIDQGHIGPSQPNTQGMWHFAPDGTVDGEHGMIFDGAIRQRDLVYRLNSVSFAGGTITLPASSGEIGSTVKIRIKSRDVILALDHPNDISINNIFPGTIDSIKPANDPGKVDVIVNIGRQQPCLLATQILKRMADELHLGKDSPIYALIREAHAI